MREADFEALLGLVERLSGERQAALGRALAAASGEADRGGVLEQACAAAPRCPHCATTAPRRWGRASGLRRYRCKACRKTFNALTGTSLARLRKKRALAGLRRALRRGPALPALRRGGTAAALGSCERAAPLSLQGLPQDLQRPDRHLPGAAAQEGALAGLRRGARGRHEPDQGSRALRRAPDDELPLAAPVPASTGGDARGAGRRGRGGRDLLSPVPQGLPPVAAWRRPARAAAAPAGRAGEPAGALG